MRLETVGELGEKTAELLRECDMVWPAPMEAMELSESRRDAVEGRGWGDEPLSIDAMLLTTLSPFVCASATRGGGRAMGERAR